MDRKYLLQVWNQNGQMIFERSLREKPVAWFITTNTFIYRPHKEDQEGTQDCYIIIYLHRDNAEIRVDVKGQPFG